MSDPNKNRPGYKETKAGWIPDDWSTSRAADLVVEDAPIRYGVVQIGPDTEGGVPIVPIKFVKLIGQATLHRSSPEIERAYVGSRVEAGDVLLSVKGTIGEVGIVPEGFEGNIARELARLRIKNDHSPEYIACQLENRHTQRRISKEVVGSTRLEFSIGTLREFHLPVPRSRSEENAIAEILRCCAKAIEKTGDLIKAKQRQKKALMQQLLTGKKRLPGFEGVWEFPKAEEVFERINQRGNGDEPVLSVTQDFGVVDRTEVGKRIDYDESNTHTYKLVEPNDFVISLRSFQGGLEISNLRGLVSPAYHVIRSRKPCCHQFYKYYFKSFEFIGRLDIAVIGIRDGKQVSYGDFSFLKIPYPPVEEQSVIADTLSATDSEIALLEARQSALKQQKNALMQKLLTGQVRVKV